MTNGLAVSVSNIAVGGTPLFTSAVDANAVVSLYLTATANATYTVFLRRNNVSYTLMQGLSINKDESRVHEGIFLPAGVTIVVGGANVACSCVGYSFAPPANFNTPSGKMFGVFSTKVPQSSRIVFDMAEFNPADSPIAEGSLFLNGTSFGTTTTKIYGANTPVTSTSELLPEVLATFRTPARVSHARINTWMMKNRYLVIITTDALFAGYLQYNIRKGA